MAIFIGRSNPASWSREKPNRVKNVLLISGAVIIFLSPPRGGGGAGRLGISWTPGPRTVAGRGVEVVVAGGLLVVVGFGVGALGAVGHVGIVLFD